MPIFINWLIHGCIGYTDAHFKTESIGHIWTNSASASYLCWSLCFILCVDTQNKVQHNTEAAHSYSRMIMLFMFSRAKGGGFPKKGNPCTLFPSFFLFLLPHKYCPTKLSLTGLLKLAMQFIAWSFCNSKTGLSLKAAQANWNDEWCQYSSTNEAYEACGRICGEWHISWHTKPQVFPFYLTFQL